VESDEELQATPYADLWLAKMGRVVPEHHPGGIVEAPHAVPEMRARPAAPEVARE
jgi:hypothetical protein